MGYGAVEGLLSAYDDSFPAFVFMLMFAVVVLGGVGTCLVWLAWQLWWHFSATTARLASATIIVFACMLLMAGVDWAIEPLQQEWLASVVALLMIIATPLVYRRLARLIIERARIDDPRDAHAHRAGHMTRVKVYCVVLGWAVFLTSGSVVRNLLPLDHDGASILVGLSPIPLGWLTYRVVLWWMTPPTSVPLPPGGFEVVPVAQNAPRDESC